MSEYQCYRWKKVGQSLSPQERREVSELSSHILVRPDSAEVTYHWGDFKHDPISVFERYFDVFLYEANWGTQRVALRFDADTVEVEDLSRFAVAESITVTEKEKEVLIEAWFDENWTEPPCFHEDEYKATDWRLEAVEVIHRQLMEGDFRGLFLLWLKACELDPEEEADCIADLPEGMAQLGDEHGILADFVGVDHRLIKEAEKRSDPLSPGESRREDLEHCLDKLSAEKKEAYLQQLLTGDARSAQIALRRELRLLGGRPQRSRSGKTVSYRELADAARRAADQEARRRKEKTEERRRSYLRELGRREDEIWDRVHALVSEKKTRTYDESLLLLRGLEDLWTERQDREHFLNAVKLIDEEFSRLTGFRRRLDEAGWLEPEKESAYLKSRRERWSNDNPLQREIDLKW